MRTRTSTSSPPSPHAPLAPAEVGFHGEARRLGNRPGLTAALILLLSWAVGVGYAWFGFDWAQASFLSSVALLFSLTFLFTGLFITAHESMHGLVSPSRYRLNRAVGRLCLFLFAGFSYDSFLPRHQLHHDQTATTLDPDFHDGQRKGAFGWYFVFMKRHLEWRPFAFFSVLILATGIAGGSLLDVALAWPVPALLSSFQLFYFGTYLPHREPAEGYNPLKSRSNDYPAWLSFLTCFHFGYHYEHHLKPFVPWWKLPAARRQLRQEANS